MTPAEYLRQLSEGCEPIDRTDRIVLGECATLLEELTLKRARLEELEVEAAGLRQLKGALETVGAAILPGARSESSSHHRP